MIRSLFYALFAYIVWVTEVTGQVYKRYKKQFFLSKKVWLFHRSITSSWAWDALNVVSQLLININDRNRDQQLIRNHKKCIWHFQKIIASLVAANSAAGSGSKVTKVSCNEKFSVQVKGKQPKDFKKSEFFYLISWTLKKNLEKKIIPK